MPLTGFPLKRPGLAVSMVPPVLCAIFLLAPRGTAGPDTAPNQPGLMGRYCVSCHNPKQHAGGLVLEDSLVADASGHAAVLEKVLHKIRSGEMPPPGLPRPEKAALNNFAATLETSLDRASSAKPYPGRVALHRLNRTEYGNAVRDLLAVEIDPKSMLTADGVDEHGFDNIATVLTVSPALMEQYLAAARRISRMAVGEVNTVPVFDTYSVPGMLSQDERMDEDLPFGSRGGMAVKHYFPVDGEYEVRIRLQRQLYGYILGMGRPHRLELSLDGKPVHSFTVGGDAPPGPSPATYAGNIMGNPAWDLYMHEADSKLVARFKANAGPATVAVWFARDRAINEDIPQPADFGFGQSINEEYEGNPAVGNVSVGGPYRRDGIGETPSRHRIFSCTPASPAPASHPDDEPCAKAILTRLARKAYRRSATPIEIATLLDFYRQGRVDGGFESGVRLAVERMLADPGFLFRVEGERSGSAPGAAYPLRDTELASRLSFFLWSSIPDEELLDAAEAGKLHDPAVLDTQIHRMLGDSRSKALVDNFAMAWLDLVKVKTAVPDPDTFPDFDENLRQAFLEETQLFIGSQIHDDRPIDELLSANYTFLNERLARHYRIPGVYGSHFRRAALADKNRGGLLGQGSILMATSYPNRTSPVLRGKWVLDAILGSAPPPPPPDVPALRDNTGDTKPLSVRARLEEHRKNPACAVCHVRMDPLGFALENFDAVGSWRTFADGSNVNVSAVMPDGTTFEGVAGLRQVLLNRRDAFAENLISKLMIYALGRQIDYHDQPAIRSVARDAASDGRRWSAVIAGIARSVPFRMTMAAPAITAAITRGDK